MAHRQLGKAFEAWIQHMMLQIQRRNKVITSFVHAVMVKYFSNAICFS
jgi:hypothetical protein